MPNIKFKYDNTPDNVVKQLAGDLIGLKPLNLSNLLPTLKDNNLIIEVEGLHSSFFQINEKLNDASQITVFDNLSDLFSQATIHADIIDGDDITKITLSKDKKIERIEHEDKLIISISLEEKV